MGFQPGIAIFTDQEGQTVYEHFVSLIRHIHRPLRHGIGLLCLPVGQSRYLGLLSSEINDMDDRATQPLPAPDGSDALSALTILQARLRSEAEMKHYRMFLSAERRPLQVYIIGRPSAATRMLAAQIRREQADQVEISALFCCTPCSQEQDLCARSSEFVSWSQANAIRFSYFYGDLTQGMQPSTPTENFTHAAALALFALLTTDLSNHAQFYADDAHHADDCRVTQHTGTLSVCLISSLHHSIRQAYAAEVAGLLVEDWQKELSTVSATPEFASSIDEALADMPLAWLSPKSEELFRADTKHRNRTITLADLAPEPETALLPRTPPEQATYTQRYAHMAEHTRKVHHQEKLARTFMRKPLTPHTWEVWLETIRPLWQQLQDEYLRQIVLQMEQIRHTSDLSGAIALATQLDERLQTIIQKLQIVCAAREHIQAQPAEQDQERSNGHQVPDQVAQEKGQQANKQARRRPEILRLNLVCLLLGALLSFVAWLFWDELGLTPSFLLLPLIASCFGGVFVTNRLYLRRALSSSPPHMRKSTQYIPPHNWMQRCLQASYQQRLDMALQLQQRVRCYTTAFLSQIGQNLALQAGTALEQPFLTSAGGRNFLCGNGRHLATAFEARLDFLDQTKRGGNFIFPNLQKTRGKESTRSERDSISNACKDLLHTFFLREARSSEQILQEMLCDEVRTWIDPWFRAAQAEHASLSTGRRVERAVTNYISRNDFELDMGAELLARVLRRAQEPTLWQGQSRDAAPTNFFCTTPGRIRGQSEKFRQPVIEVATTLAQEQGAPSELTSRWILLCALYR